MPIKYSQERSMKNRNQCIHMCEIHTKWAELLKYTGKISFFNKWIRLIVFLILEDYSPTRLNIINLIDRVYILLCSIKMNTYFISFITIIIFANGINGTSVDTSNKLLLQKANDFNLSQTLSRQVFALKQCTHYNLIS